MLRKPAVSGAFYEASRERLIKQIEDCFFSCRGPGHLPGEKQKPEVLGLVAPHAGYAFSGACAAHAYAQLNPAKEAAFVILGVNHSGIGSSSVSLSDFETPLGTARNDLQLSRKIASFSMIPSDERPHFYEHSIEVQVPFLQYICRERLRIVPIIVDFSCDYAKLASAMLLAAKELAREVVVIASSDFTHYGPNYGETGLGESAEQKVKEDDLSTIQHILKKSPEDFFNAARMKTICGIHTITALLHYISLAEKTKQVDSKPELLKYYQSSEIMPSGSFVGYASIVFRKAGPALKTQK
jgi:hypothetical protein